MNAVRVAEPSVCAQLMSRGTLRKRNHFVPRTAAVRSSTQSSGTRTAVSTSERLGFVLAATVLLPCHRTVAGHLARDDRVEPGLDPVHVRPRRRPRVALDGRLRAGAVDVGDREDLAEDQAVALDREGEAVERAHRRAGAAVPLGVVEAAVARAPERLCEHGCELDAPDLLRVLLVDRPIRLDRAAEVDAAAVEDGEARLSVG